VGILTLEKALMVRAGELTLPEAIVKDIPTTTADTQISELLPIAAEALYPIAVVNEEGHLEGIVTKAAVLASLI